MSKTSEFCVQRGEYILASIQELTLNGDSYVSKEALFDRAKLAYQKLSWATYSGDMAYLLKTGKLHRVGCRIYAQRTHQYEQSIAQHLTEILAQNDLPAPALPDPLTVQDITLDDVQRQAIASALSHHLSIILGGAGSGKTTLVTGLVRHCPDRDRGSVVLCAPTGKAACNLNQRTGLPARTVHSALSKCPDDDFLAPVDWHHVRLVVVDEASMMTLELLAGILHVATEECRIVLVGDPNQLLSVGAGNVLPDLLKLGVPSITLTQCHRQEDTAQALQFNVRNFKNCATLDDLKQDESFAFAPMFDEVEIQKFIAHEGAKRYLNGESVQVLSPYNAGHLLSVSALNGALRKLVNPVAEDTPCLDYLGRKFYTYDRVMITKNDWKKELCNGHIGQLFLLSTDEKQPQYGVITDHAVAAWSDWSGVKNMTHAYANTIHKSQGSEYDTVIIPVHKHFTKSVHRNLLYTAISRAKKQVILVGDPDALSHALRTPAPLRKSELVAQTNMKKYRVIRKIGDIA